MKTVKALGFATALAVSTFSASSAYAAAPLFDGSFENTSGIGTDPAIPVCQGGYCYKKGSATTVVGTSPAGVPHTNNIVFSGNGSVSAVNGSGFGFANATAGTAVAILQGGAASITTKIYNLVFGAVYQVIFSAQGRPDYGLNPINVSVGIGGNYQPHPTTGYLGGQTVGVFTPGTAGFADYSGTFKFVGGASNALTFTGLGVPGQDVATAFDNVRLNLISAPTPEPVAYLTMILGFGMVGAFARRRAKKVAFAA